MQGMNIQTGKLVKDIRYLQQRLRDVLTTPKNSRVMNREFGCGLFQRLDETMNEAWLVQCYSDIATALKEPKNGLLDFELEKIQPVDIDEQGAIFQLSGVYKPTGERVTLSTPLNEAIGVTTA